MTAKNNSKFRMIHTSLLKCRDQKSWKRRF